MASNPPVLNVVITDEATAEFKEIWRWNVVERSLGHADRYLAFLKKNFYALASSYHLGKHIEGNPSLRYINIRRKPKVHGHVAVYRVEEQTVHVLHIFHTAQDWRTLVPDE
jgi:plasmid stabilization system protein ParE